MSFPNVEIFKCPHCSGSFPRSPKLSKALQSECVMCVKRDEMEIHKMSTAITQQFTDSRAAAT